MSKNNRSNPAKKGSAQRSTSNSRPTTSRAASVERNHVSKKKREKMQEPAMPKQNKFVLWTSVIILGLCLLLPDVLALLGPALANTLRIAAIVGIVLAVVATYRGKYDRNPKYDERPITKFVPAVFSKVLKRHDDDEFEDDEFEDEDDEYEDAFEDEFEDEFEEEDDEFEEVPVAPQPRRRRPTQPAAVPAPAPVPAPVPNKELMDFKVAYAGKHADTAATWMTWDDAKWLAELQKTKKPAAPTQKELVQFKVDYAGKHPDTAGVWMLWDDAKWLAEYQKAAAK